MKNLVGKTILVGKEPQTNNLLLSVEVNGQIKTKSLSENVPNSVSRCFPDKDVAHCKIEVQDPETIIIHNTKSPNKTFVNSQEILKKRIQRDSRVELGADHFSLDVDKVLTSAIQLVNPLVKPLVIPDDPKRLADKDVKGPKDSYSLVHLKPVWENYERELKDINSQHEKINKLKQGVQRGVMIGIPAIVAAVQVADDNSILMKILITLGVLAVSTALSFFISGLIKDPSEQRKKEQEAYLTKNYVCPNCGIFLGKHSYEGTISHKMKCGNCGIKYIHNMDVEEE